MERFFVRFYKKGIYLINSFDTINEARHFAMLVNGNIYDYYYNKIV